MIGRGLLRAAETIRYSRAHLLHWAFTPKRGRDRRAMA